MSDHEIDPVFLVIALVWTAIAGGLEALYVAAFPPLAVIFAPVAALALGFLWKEVLFGRTNHR